MSQITGIPWRVSAFLHKEFLQHQLWKHPSRPRRKRQRAYWQSFLTSSSEASQQGQLSKSSFERNCKSHASTQFTAWQLLLLVLERAHGYLGLMVSQNSQERVHKQFPNTFKCFSVSNAYLDDASRWRSQSPNTPEVEKEASTGPQGEEILTLILILSHKQFAVSHFQMYEYLTLLVYSPKSICVWHFCDDSTKLGRVICQRDFQCNNLSVCKLSKHSTASHTYYQFTFHLPFGFVTWNYDLRASGIRKSWFVLKPLYCKPIQQEHSLLSEASLPLCLPPMTFIHKEHST